MQVPYLIVLTMPLEQNAKCKKQKNRLSGRANFGGNNNNNDNPNAWTAWSLKSTRQSGCGGIGEEEQGCESNESGVTLYDITVNSL